MYKLNDIKHLHLEISSLCNASCPLCPRNCHGYNHNFGYEEKNLKLEEVKKIFPLSFLKQLNRILINGNFGDMVMNPETPDIVEYFLSINSDLIIDISTNGGARDKTFWERLAKLKCTIVFCIDGTDNDTHSIYRRNTRFDTVIKNANIFINAGGTACWKFIEFQHNQHQVQQAQQLAADMGFDDFFTVPNSHGNGPILDKNKNIVYNLETEHEINFPVDLLFYVGDLTNYQYPPMTEITCEVQQDKSIYVNSLGEVYPCCYLGFNPRTFRSPATAYENSQIQKILKPNNAIQNDFENCLNWFSSVEESWNKNWSDGRLVKCNQQCGSCH